MNCPKCDSIILSDDVNIEALVAKCRQCHEVFRVTDQLSPTGTEGKPSQPMRVPRPASLVVQDDGDIRVIRRRWFRPAYLFLLMFCVFWDGFLVFWYAIGFVGLGRGDKMEWVFFVFPLLHVTVGLGLTYFVVAGLFNKSYVGVTSEGLYVRHRPVPWYGNLNLATAEVKEMYLERSYTQSTNGRPVQQMYNLTAVTEDGRQRKLLGGLELPEAQFCAQQLNDWLSLAPSRLGVPLHAPG